MRNPWPSSISIRPIFDALLASLRSHSSDYQMVLYRDFYGLIRTTTL